MKDRDTKSLEQAYSQIDKPDSKSLKQAYSQIDKPDSITLDVPLLIRLFELMREEVKDDVTIHKVTENLLKHKGIGTLSMKHYPTLIAGTSVGNNKSSK